MNALHARGFTLIQTCFIVVILSLLAVGALNLYKVYVVQAYIDTTDDRIETVQNAIRDFFAANGYLPCPADPSKTPGNAAYGKAAASCTGGPVASGAVPIRTLSIGDEYMADTSGLLFIYAVSPALTVTGATMLDTAGNITNGQLDILNSSDGTTSILAGTGPIGGCTQTVPAAPGGAGHAPYVLISPKACAWTRAGVQQTCTAGSFDYLNAHNTTGKFYGGSYVCLKDKNGKFILSYSPRGGYYKPK